MLGNESLSLGWNPIQQGEVAGYRVYVGQTSGNYSSRLDVSGTNATVQGLSAGVVYYFVVTAYTAFGVESEFSEEISVRVPLASGEGPYAESQDLWTYPDTALSIVLGEAQGANGPLEYEIVSPPAHGSLDGTAPELTYIPNAGFGGEDRFTFVVRNGEQTSPEGTISITVGTLESVPAARSQTLAAFEDHPADLVLAGESPGASPLTYAVTEPPAHGTLSGEPPALTYTPQANYFGPDTLSFTVSDGIKTSAPAKVFFTVVAVNDRPLGRSTTVYLNRRMPAGDSSDGGQPAPVEYLPLGISLLGFDQEQAKLSFEILHSPRHGVLSGIPPHVTYVPDSTYEGRDVIWFRVRDEIAASKLAAITVRDPAIPAPPPRLISSLEEVEFQEYDEPRASGKLLRMEVEGPPFKQYRLLVSANLTDWTMVNEAFADQPVVFSEWLAESAPVSVYQVAIEEAAP